MDTYQLEQLMDRFFYDNLKESELIETEIEELKGLEKALDEVNEIMVKRLPDKKLFEQHDLIRSQLQMIELKAVFRYGLREGFKLKEFILKK